MIKNVYYMYLGENGTIETPIYIPNVYSIKKYILTAEEGKILINSDGEKRTSVIVGEKDLDVWKEINK